MKFNVLQKKGAVMPFNSVNRFEDAEHEALMGVWWSGVLLRQIARRFFRDQTVAESQFNVLMALRYAERALSQQDLSERLLVDKSNLTGLIDGLMKRGFVRRFREKRDRRFYRLKLTGEGAEFLEKLEPAYLELVHGIMNEFTPEERTRLTEYMVRLQRRMEQWK